MSYNKAVQKARDKIGKEDPVIVVPDVDAPNEAIQGTRSEEITPLRVLQMQTVYGCLSRTPRRLISQISDETGVTANTLGDLLPKMVKEGILVSEILPKRGQPKCYSINVLNPIPEGWPTLEEMKNLPKLEPTYPPTQPGKPKIYTGDIEKARDNPLTKMLLKDDTHAFDVSGYQQFIEDTKKFYGIKELDDVIKVLHKLCQKRIDDQFVECPICKGRIERHVSEARCKKCGTKIDAGTFEKSMEMFSILAKNGVSAL